jgi:hypothetical protein
VDKHTWNWPGEELGKVLGSATEHDPVDVHSAVTQLDGGIGKRFIVEESLVQV